MTDPKTPAPKRSTTKAAIKKPVAAMAKAAAPKTLAATGEVTKKELLEQIVAETGMKKSEARVALNATLSALHGAITQGKNVSAAPLGKLRITRRKETPNGELVVLRLKLKQDGKGAKDPVAEPGGSG